MFIYIFLLKSDLLYFLKSVTDLERKQ